MATIDLRPGGGSEKISIWTLRARGAPVVLYSYQEMSGGVNNSRLNTITYPDGYVLTMNYSTGLNSTISRLSSLSDSSDTLEAYKYLGLDNVVERDHPQTNVNQTFISQTGGVGDAGDDARVVLQQLGEG